MRMLIACLALAAAGFSDSHDDGDRNGNWVYAVNEHTLHMSGSTEDVFRAGRALGKTRGLWFVRDGKEYIVTDAKLLARVEALMLPLEQLGRKQGELGKKQGELGKKQGQLGKRMSQLSGGGAASERDIDDLSRQMEALGRQQEALGSQQEALGEQQERAAETMQREMDKLEAQAIASGQAKAI